MTGVAERDKNPRQIYDTWKWLMAGYRPLRVTLTLTIEAKPRRPPHLQAPSKTPRALPMKYSALFPLPNPLKAMPAVR